MSEGVDLIQMVQDMAQWWVFVNTIMNFSGSINGREFLTS
jgi:hypothetical protein